MSQRAHPHPKTHHHSVVDTQLGGWWLHSHSVTHKPAITLLRTSCPLILTLRIDTMTKRKGVASLMVYKDLLKARGDGNETKP